MFGRRTPSLNKLKTYAFQAYRWYQRNKDRLPLREKEELIHLFQQLDTAFAQEDREKAFVVWQQIDPIVERRKERRVWDYPLELLGAIAFALFVATLVRQMVFEFYEIPSGSMRPTFREHDHLIVSKTTFGINIPFTVGHVYFDPDLVQRGGVFIFTGENIDLPDTDTRYFWLFPAKKRYIKRCMGKPGDSFYFYGGMLFAVDKEGNDITELRQPPFDAPLDHVPFNTFEGRVDKETGMTPKKQVATFIYKHINTPVGKLTYSTHGDITGEVFNGKEWIKDQPQALKRPHQEIKTFADFLGIKNFGMTRILNKQEMRLLHPNFRLKEEHPLYLEIAYAPQLTPMGTLGLGEPPPMITGQLNYHTTLLPLTKQDIDTISQHLYTARFTVADGRARRWDATGTRQYDVPLKGVPDGTYEFYDGKGYQMGWLGWSEPLPETHPLYKKDTKTIQALYNYGNEFSTYYHPTSSYFAPFPARYIYFREGSLYLMGKPFIDKSEERLQQWKKEEEKKGQKEMRYIPFVDYGPPLKEGKLDVEFIRTFGYTLGENEYLALGDNYAMSSDSRTFGPVPGENLEGTPSFILWPPQGRFGSPNANPYAFWTFPSILVWSLLGCLTLLVWFWDTRRKSLPIFKEP